MQNQFETHMAVLNKAGFSSLACMGHLSCDELRACLHDDVSPEQIEALHAAACDAHDESLILEKKILTRASPLLPNALKAGLAPSDVSQQDYEAWFGGRATQYAAPGDVASMFSPAAYLAALYREATVLYPEGNPWHIDSRRPDLKRLVLSQANLDTPVGALRLSNAILTQRVRAVLAQKNVDAVSDDQVLQALASHVNSIGTPYHHHHQTLRQVQIQKDPDFEQILAASHVIERWPSAAMAAIYYDIPPALQALLTDPVTLENANERFTYYFPGHTPQTLLQPIRLRNWFALTDAELQAFIGKVDDPAFGGAVAVAELGAEDEPVDDATRASHFALNLNKRVRLYKATGIEPQVLEDIIQRVDPQQITHQTLTVLLRTSLLMKRYGISHEQALVLDKGPVSQTAATGRMSHFNRLFNDPPLVEGGLAVGNTAFQLHPQHSAEQAQIKDTLKRACGTDDEGLYELGQILAASQGQALKLTTEARYLFGLYTLSLWARLHGLAPAELRQLLDMMGLPSALHTEDATVWQALLERLHATVRWLRARGWSVADLKLMTRDVTHIPASTEITNLLNDMKAVIVNASLPEAPTAQDYGRAITPLLASAFSLSGETAAQALLTWSTRAQPGGLTWEQAWRILEQDAPDDAGMRAVVAFAYGLVQMALVVHGTGLSADALALLVERPQTLTNAAVQGEEGATTLACNLETVMALADFSDWLKALPDPAGAGGAVLGALGDPQGISPALLARVAGLPEAAVLQAATLAMGDGDVAQAPHLTNWQAIVVVRQWVTLAAAFGVMPNTLESMLKLNANQDTPATWAQWGAVADAFQAGLTSSQAKEAQAAVEAPLSRALAGVLTVGQNPNLEVLNQHLLLDSLNSAHVTTTRIAEATAALQMFIHRTLSRPEDKNALRQGVLDREFFRQWTRWNARYATWSAGQMLMYYPENYIDPTTRQGQTKAMDEMLQVLGQAQINTDTVGDAFQGYLSAFEEVANLEVVSGYHDSRDADRGKSWLIGVSRGEPREYWWRSVDEAKRGPDGQLPANAWTGWTKIDLAAQVQGRMIRPVVYRERLYLMWVERQEHVIARDAQGKPTQYEWRWSYKLSWLRYDGSWSAPLDYPLPADDIQRLEGKGQAKAPLSLFLSARPGRNTLLVGIYDHDTVRGRQITDFAGLEIFEDLHSRPASIASMLSHVSHWLDTPGSTGMCAVFDGEAMPVAREQMPPDGDSPVPASFAKFDAALKQAKVVDVSEEDGSYSLSLDTLLTVEAKRPEVENIWVKELIGAYRQLRYETEQIPALARSDKGVFMVREEDGQRFGYLCISAARFEDFFPREHRYIREVFDTYSSWARGTFDHVNTPLGRAYLGRFPVGNGDLLSRYIGFRQNNELVVPKWPLKVTDLLEHPAGFGEDQVTPRLYVESIGRVSASEIKRTTFGVDGQAHWDDTASTDVDLSRGPQQVAFTSVIPIGRLNEWHNKQEGLHRVTFQFGAGHVRHYSIQVYREADTLKTAVIQTHDSGAQFLARKGWVTRLNTLFARQLTERAISGIDTILSYDTQQIPEPGIGVGVRLTLPVYDKDYHGTDKSVQVWLCTDQAQRTLLWSGELSETQTVVAQLSFAPDAVRGNEMAYHLETRYQGRHHTAEQGLSVVIQHATHEVIRSSDVGEPKLDKRNIDSVLVLGHNATSLMDFQGANALYFWELFYYSPMMVMQRFLQEERFDLAEQWLKYVFNPAGYTVRGQYTSRMWNVRPLEEDTSWNDQPLKSLDPDAIAQNDPMHYRLNVFMRLLDITLGQGDSAYRKLERDSLAEAKVWYQRAQDLLGDSPWTLPDSAWGDPLLGQAASAEALDARMDALSLLAQGVKGEHKARSATGTRFLPEANRVMLGYWETLRIRLHNLRHDLSLDGQPLSLPFYTSPAAPKALLAAAVAAQGGGARSLPEIKNLPALRFTPLLEGARAMAAQLIQFGGTLQNILKRQDAEALAELVNTQGVELAASSVALQKQSLKELASERVTLEKTLEGVIIRRDYYRGLADENINARELHALNLSTASQSIAAGAKVAFMAGAVLDALPNIFGLANGGHKPGRLCEAVGIGYTLYADALQIASDRVSKEEEYRRRYVEWRGQEKAAEREMGIIQSQLDTLSAREASMNMQIAHLQTQSAHAQAQMALLRGKFTGKAMYSWLRARLATIFYTYYDLTVSRCLMAQKALQWEKGDSTTYLRTGTWNGAWAGLLCGEGLMLALGQMEDAWVKWQKREMEVTRSVSLAQLFAGKLEGDAALGDVIEALVEGAIKEAKVAQLPLSGLTVVGSDLVIQVGLKELGLAIDFKDKTRRVRSIAVSLPALLGPYQNVRARLRTNARHLPAGCEECAISHGMQDNGLFGGSGSDPHPRWGAEWLPFEGLDIALPSDPQDATTLTLTFADAKGEQKALLQRLSNVILHVQYSVR